MEPSTETLSKVEVLPVRGGRRLRPDEVKARIVAETLEPRATVRGVARRYDAHSNQLTGWRAWRGMGVSCCRRRKRIWRLYRWR